MDDSIYQKLLNIVGVNNISREEGILYLYSSDVAVESEKWADCVIRPFNKSEVREILKIANENSIPITPVGARSGASGGSVPIKGGILLDLTRMNDILNIDLKKMTVTVEPGVVITQLNEQLKSHGVFFPVDLGSSDMATIGGTISNNGGGLRAVKYGVMKNYVDELEIILVKGEEMTLNSEQNSNIGGINLLNLFIGSEGTLGIIIKATLRILPIPKFKGVLLAIYDDLKKSGETVINIYKKGIIPSAMEILDKSAIVAINKYKPEMNLPENAEAIILFELNEKHPIEEDLNNLEKICLQVGAVEIKKSTDEKERIKLWDARKLVGAASTRVREGFSRVYLGEDITVPPSKIPELLLKLRELSKEYDLPIVVFGHIGDGNLHPAITIRKNVPNDIKKVEELEDKIHRYAIDIGGITTGEHGIGLRRAPYLKIERPGELMLMRKIKKIFDPNNLLNPGKMDLDAAFQS
ncbi:MAG: FAD-binding protein [Candidatus Lokiarchaeota archaeon]|nr:FAD-binding protein [Candidatus Lokiarchaeota archaeon]